MFEQNLTLRRHAPGRFRPFLLDMSRDTAMLVWLDSNRNVKGAPNENFAREVMELFSLGVGNYTEKDMQEAARAFTGWHHDPEVAAFEFNDALHDAGSKTVLGRAGRLDGADVLKICCDRPACARFLVGKLYAFLVSETPPPKPLLLPLETRFRSTDYDIADLVRTMLGSRLFFSDHAYRKRVKWPIEYALAAVRGLVPGRLPPGDLVEPLAKMGQALFAPPNVKGWRTGTDWLNSATLLARNNFAEAVAMGSWSKGGKVRLGEPNVQAAIVEAEEAVDQVLTAGVDFGKVEALAGVVGAAASYAPLEEVLEVPAEASSQTDKPSAKKPDPPKPQPLPAPAPERDVLAVIFAAKPATVPALVRRMGEVLYGEPVGQAARMKIEKFLLDGKTGVARKGHGSAAIPTPRPRGAARAHVPAGIPVELDHHSFSRDAESSERSASMGKREPGHARFFPRPRHAPQSLRVAAKRRFR